VEGKVSCGKDKSAKFGLVSGGGGGAPGGDYGR